MSFLTSVYTHLAAYNLVIWWYVTETMFINAFGVRFPIPGLGV